MKEYEALLKDVAQNEETLAQSSFDHETARAQFIMNLSNNATRRPLLQRQFWLAAAVALGCVLLVTGIYFLGVTQQISSTPQWVQVGHRDTQLLRFDDGTKVRFNENSAGRVTQIATHEGEVTLENGRVDLQVTHTKSTQWHVLAGPYRVAVTGTKFEVKWNPQRSQLEVNVFEGSVLVTGPMIENGHAVVANRSLTANPSTSHVQLSALDMASADTEVVPSVNNGSAETLAEKETANHARASANTSKKSGRTAKAASNRQSLSWVKDAQAGRYSSVSRQIKALGLRRMLKDAQPAHYLLLGNAARQASDFATAQKVYLQLRTQFAGSGHAATAALYLGRMAFDKQHQYPKAVKWFTTYLNEQQSGTLHRETLGRLMEAQYKSQMKTDAQRTAQRYLSKYPTGPHSSRAKELSGQ